MRSRHLGQYVGLAAVIGSFSIQDCSSEETVPYWKREAKLHGDILSGTMADMEDIYEYNPRVPPKVSEYENPVVNVGINVFKIKEINIATSIMSLNAWLRISWNDPRLAWNSSDPRYFNVNQTVFKASTDPEITQVWVPDLELYNQDESLSSMADKDALVYPDGSVFWSRIGNIGALCAFSGIQRHPFDVIECTMDFSGWTRSAHFADYRLMDPPVSYQETGTGKSTYQEYAVLKGKERASISHFAYPCCPGEDWPTLSFTFVFERKTTNYYQRSLVLVMISFTFLAAAVFFLDVRCGERLGYGITVLLAMIATEIVASELLPTCPEFIWIEVMSFGSSLFATLCLIETCIVTHIYYKQRPEDISEHISKSDKDDGAEDFKDCVSDEGSLVELIDNSSRLDVFPPGDNTSFFDCVDNSKARERHSPTRSTLRQRASVKLAKKLQSITTRREKKEQDIAENRAKRWREERGLNIESFRLVQKIDRISWRVFIATYPLFLIVMYSTLPLWSDKYAVNL
mmetsp:Transcript_17441/g.25761  ORF Transcript_17441/g.25761 Transcript_17441/m.25761 type:complete len:516 (+) Transcript_17441:44-1591(+)